MRYRKLSADGDYTFGNGQENFYINTPEGVGQSVKTRLLLWIGEWFLDIDEGVPYMQAIIGKKTKQEADIAIQERILSTEGVTELLDFQSEIDPDTRKISMSCSIDTIYGPTKVQIANYANF